ncbi:MAG: hypothetical protein ACUZ8I_06565 [Candidatus Scalindua sp.]
MSYLIDTDICIYWWKGNVINDADMFIASCALQVEKVALTSF